MTKTKGSKPNAEGTGPLKQAKQESPTGGGTRMSGHDRAAVAESGSNPSKTKSSQTAATKK